MKEAEMVSEVRKWVDAIRIIRQRKEISENSRPVILEPSHARKLGWELLRNTVAQVPPSKCMMNMV